MDLLVQDDGQAIWQTPAGVYLSSLSPSSQHTMKYALLALAKLLMGGPQTEEVIYDLPWTNLSHAHLLQLRSILSETYALATANLYLSALRGVLRAGWKLGKLNHDEYSRLVDFDPLSGTTIPKGRALTSEELKTLFEHLRGLWNNRGIRDGAIIALLYACGFRRSELISLNWEDFEVLRYNEGTGYRVTLHRGKGRKARVNFVNPGAAVLVDRWIGIRGKAPGWMVCRVDKLPSLETLTTQTVYDCVTLRAKEAGLKPTRPHDLRRTMCTRLLDSGVDVFRVQRLMGHADVATTQRYDRRQDQGLIQAAFSLEEDFEFGS